MEIEIQTKPFGKMQISEKQILSFPEGLLGFEDYKKFALIEEEEESVFKWLQSVEEVDLAFVVIPPSLFKKEYKPLIPEQELQGIGITDLEDGLMLVIVTVPGEDPALMTANMQGPILINKETLLGKQFISRNESHSVREKILASAAVEMD
ncbi:MULTISPECIES: flagellar assembly protein FliW [Leptospira]|uniref:Flagellar assembly factor FliW n=5 Tax=Leptospira borgpetersenii TaxID=174 RepID=M3HR35_LEPBO|nr:MULTISPECIES: flagellar assembly protein FliW [Leptospira]EMG00090.1 protein FliW [Leptospira borgpetersenii str. 200701203]EMO08465.1 protein FliW [Leptospira borgpetersenii str. Noumea 25]ALO28123.1 protein FliW [Leptospira borgpetersenii serovar Ballum]ANH02258.1 Flagellar assembly factor FliW [Leptospira borgpetersenii str. 4E]AXX17021.1 flagellar assembly protein FliW [Leptospira borgpetersenii serovar Ceylonica]